ncbi:hypothetical protein COCMIDRAFT_27723 [Bipolaris oryzae ATCC 44560]|uniref:EamA domain-containing protein n=1 Tax=Bipolaris oryzae ATCC 44560 TaxID=930090 RepID=W6Z283_COCMI|nr:uncharacterized protein COCMIDRAFT_27723 [Bipolaris oryzae ATCC 44560]EUC43813.1 hypothetical protein COCMIDRAFT_27723 [Bipolaris oryzae ATCC 44560]
MISKGSLLVFVSQVFAVIVHTLAKFLETTGDIDPQQILQVRMFVTLSLNSLCLRTWYSRELPLGSYNLRYLLVLRVVGGICGSFGFYCDATVLNLLAPLGAGFLICRRLDLLRLSSVLISLLGVGLITKPNFIFDHLYHDGEHRYAVSGTGFAFSIMGVLGGMIAYSIISAIGERAHPLAVTNCFATGVLVVSSVCFAVIPGITGSLMEYFLTAGLTSERDGAAVYMISLQVVLALIADVCVWGTSPDSLSLIGSVLVLSAVVATERWKNTVEPRENFELSC